MIINRALRNLANRQWGYFTARQAADCGYPRNMQSYHAKTGNWCKVDRALYRLPGYADCLEADFVRWSLWAEGLRAPRQVVVGYGSALHYYGLLAERPQSVDLLVSSLKSTPEPPGCRLHLAEVEEDELQRFPGFFLTSLSRTLADMRPELQLAGRWGDLLRDALACGRLTPQQAQELNDNQPLALPPAAVAADGQWLRWSAHTPREDNTMATHAGSDLRRFAARPARLSPNRSFTLVEMLVVIAIIAVLAALLMPALSRAQNSARNLTCVNGLRSIGMGLGNYVESYNGWLPPFRYTCYIAGVNMGNCYWPVFLSEFLPSRVNNNNRTSVQFLCPRDPAPYGRNTDGSYKTAPNFDFGYTGVGSYGAGATYFPYNSGLGANHATLPGYRRYARDVRSNSVLLTDNVFMALVSDSASDKFPAIFNWHDGDTVNLLNGGLGAGPIDLARLAATTDNK